MHSSLKAGIVYRGAGQSPGRWRTIAFGLLFAVMLVPAAQAEPRTSTDPAQTTDLLTFIRGLEAPRGYDDYERRIPIAPPHPLTQMRLGEVLDWQRRVRAAGAPSTAAGGYQIIYPTLLRLVQKHDLDLNAVFDAVLQDRLAQRLIAECGPRPKVTAQRAHGRFGNCLAGIWAALPLTTGPGRGRSAYHGVAGNRALTSPETVLALLSGTPVDMRRAPQPVQTGQHLEQIRRAFQNRSLSFEVGPSLFPSKY